MPVKVDSENCIGCAACVDVCKRGALSICEHGHCHVDKDKCVDCGKCVETCPVGVIKER